MGGGGGGGVSQSKAKSNRVLLYTSTCRTITVGKLRQHN